MHVCLSQLTNLLIDGSAMGAAALLLDLLAAVAADIVAFGVGKIAP